MNGRYRAKVKSDDPVISKRWAYGDKAAVGGRTFIIPDDAIVYSEYTESSERIVGFIEVVSKTVGQSTGLSIVVDLETIWADDIVAFSIFGRNDNDTQYQGVVKFVQGEWQVWNVAIESGMFGNDGPFSLWWVLSQDVEAEIVRSIHDNPELAEETE